MAKKYLDDNGLLYLWGKIKALFVQKETGKGLSTNDYTTAEKNKLAGIAEGAEVNVQSDWNATSGDAFIKNKPTIPSAVQPTTTTPKMDGTASVGSETKYAKGDHVHPSDTSRVPTTRKVNGHALSADVTVTKGDVGLGNVDNTSDADKPVSTATQTALDGKISSTEKGQANGVCPLDANSKVDASYLPSFVDDVVEAYPVSGATELSAGWLSETSGGSALTPASGVIYVLMADTTNYATNTQFRWATNTYVKLNDGGVTAITNGEIDTIVAS